MIIMILMFEFDVANADDIDDVDDTEYDETHHKHHYQCKALDDVPFLEVYAQVINKPFGA